MPHRLVLDIKGDDSSINLFDLSGSIRVRFDDGRLRADNITGPEFHVHFADGRVEPGKGLSILDLLKMLALELQGA